MSCAARAAGSTTDGASSGRTALWRLRYAFGHALYQRVLYDRLSPSRRAILHQQIGERLEAGYATRTAEVSGELAIHFQRSRDRRRAVAYLEQAARRAYDRLAYSDAVASLDPALRLLGELPDTPERARDELRLRQLYTVGLSQTAGYVAEGLLENLTRARRLCEQLADPAGLFDVLCALCLLHSNGGDLREAERVGEELSPLSEQLNPSAVVEASFLRGGVSLWGGDLDAAEPFLAKALSSSVSPEEADRLYGVNPLVAARSFESLRRWVRAEPDRARAVQGEAMALAERLGRPFTVAHAAAYAAFLHVLDGEWREAARMATRAADLSDEYGFPLWSGTALVIRGRALVEQGEGERGLAEIREGLDVLRRAKIRLAASLWFSLLAETCLRLDRVDEGLAATDAGLTHCRDTAARLFEAELWRVRGELILRGARSKTRPRPGAIRESEECFGKLERWRVPRGRTCAVPASGTPGPPRRASRHADAIRHRRGYPGEHRHDPREQLVGRREPRTAPRLKMLDPPGGGPSRGSVSALNCTTNAFAYGSADWVWARSRSGLSAPDEQRRAPCFVRDIMPPVPRKSQGNPQICPKSALDPDVGVSDQGGRELLQFRTLARWPRRSWRDRVDVGRLRDDEVEQLPVEGPAGGRRLGPGLVQ